jgi:hypothetical protein
VAPNKLLILLTLCGFGYVLPETQPCSGSTKKAPSRLWTDNYNVASAYFTGAKYAIYSKWKQGAGPHIDGSVSQEFEYYDYNYLTNRSELGNDYSTTNVFSNTVLKDMIAILGNGPINTATSFTPATGLIATELMKPLQALGLMTYQNVAYNAYNNWINTALGGCS